MKGDIANQYRKYRYMLRKVNICEHGLVSALSAFPDRYSYLESITPRDNH